MKTYQVAVSRMIDAPLQEVYKVVIDMEEHRRILPKQFESLEVLQGGNGAGTVFRLGMNVMGARQTLVMTVTEPEPGRIVRECDEAAGVTTVWTLTPSANGRQCLLKLTTDFPCKPGFAGLAERLVSPPIVRSMYRRELDNMNAYLTAGITHPPTPVRKTASNSRNNSPRQDA
ncbi:hypothetical protein SD70_18245 [Gordoniibacillus kamchatkensis]|uniref:Polyketide cyclase / dehydrase and lipid transport n=1 Tax=Gordoniibacillus kamchatkensis TaxID=1590651 RepID=A0ABR5AF67_9BACL|nr:SRPBCC family protein [Paenibacillus sp. VKM B-2647]KIL39701.1 hypothetical protein SD70_18245 [Paenibacillus sp. VKM B-2647]